MINVISYLMPFFGLVVCLVVVFTRKIDTKCPIRVTKMVLWLVVWMLVAYYDYPYDAIKETSDTTARVLLLIINCLYIAESILYRHKRIK
ncbi:hypothetical protein [Psychrobacter immobilis]|uniref:hypothetical protein n=1 Tax=Psychrobacter immobilis TaxID=498 RepID=UPI003FD3FB28